MEEQKHRLEMSQVHREMEKVMENFEKSREVAAIVDRKRKRGEELQQVDLLTQHGVLCRFTV